MEKQPLKILGLIGARSGSKGIPHKNIKPLLGKPLMGWIIEAAKKSKYINRIVISTDSGEYAEIAKQHGAEAPFIRPAELSEDHVPDFPWIHHAATWLHEKEGWQPDIVVRLPPTSPIVRTEDIDACIELLINDPDADAAYTIIEPAKHPYKMWRISASGEHIEPFLPETITNDKEIYNKPRQSYPKAFYYIDASAIRFSTITEKKSLSGNSVRFRIIDEAIDIDTIEDFEKAEAILKKRLEQNEQ
jgi:N-acylneuraminate cytidylyltransferase